MVLIKVICQHNLKPTRRVLFSKKKTNSFQIATQLPLRSWTKMWKRKYRVFCLGRTAFSASAYCEKHVYRIFTILKHSLIAVIRSSIISEVLPFLPKETTLQHLKTKADWASFSFPTITGVNRSSIVKFKLSFNPKEKENNIEQYSFKKPIILCEGLGFFSLFWQPMGTSWASIYYVMFGWTGPTPNKFSLKTEIARLKTQFSKLHSSDFTVTIVDSEGRLFLFKKKLHRTTRYIMLISIEPHKILIKKWKNS